MIILSSLYTALGAAVGGRHAAEAADAALREPRRLVPLHRRLPVVDEPWLRTNGVDANGAAAEVRNFDRLRKRYALALLGTLK